jgi:hypothetical protein
MMRHFRPKQIIEAGSGFLRQWCGYQRGGFESER